MIKIFDLFQSFPSHLWCIWSLLAAQSLAPANKLGERIYCTQRACSGSWSQCHCRESLSNSFHGWSFFWLILFVLNLIKDAIVVLLLPNGWWIWIFMCQNMLIFSIDEIYKSNPFFWIIFWNVPSRNFPGARCWPDKAVCGCHHCFHCYQSPATADSWRKFDLPWMSLVLLSPNCFKCKTVL